MLGDLVIQNNAVTHFGQGIDAIQSESNYFTPQVKYNNLWSPMGSGPMPVDPETMVSESDHNISFRPYYVNPDNPDLDSRDFNITHRSPNRKSGTNGTHVGRYAHTDAPTEHLAGFLFGEETLTNDRDWLIHGDLGDHA